MTQRHRQLGARRTAAGNRDVAGALQALDQLFEGFHRQRVLARARDALGYRRARVE